MVLTEQEHLEELKGEIEEIKAAIVTFLDTKFSEIEDTIDARISQLEDGDAEPEDEDEDDFEDDNEDSDEEFQDESSTVQQRVNAALLSQQIATQLQTVGNSAPVDPEASDIGVPSIEEPPIIMVSTPAPNLAELIKTQVNEVKEVVVQSTPVINLSELVSKQVEEQNTLSVVAPAHSQGEVVAPPPPQPVERPLNAIIAELRSDVHAQVDAAAEEETDHLVEQVVSSTPDSNSEHSEDLALKIRTQLVSSEIKKQLS